MSLGFGTSPWGTGAFGFGTVTPTDPRETVTITARLIDPLTGDYSYDATARALESTTSVAQRVLIMVGSTLSSGAAVPGIGLSAIQSGKIDSRFKAKITAQIRRTLAQLTDVEKVMKILEIIVTTTTRGCSVILTYVDLTNVDETPQFLQIALKQ